MVNSKSLNNLRQFKKGQSGNSRGIRKKQIPDLWSDLDKILQKKITVQEIRDPKNNTVFTPSKQVLVTGYVASVDPGGFQETCNCKRTDLRDVHINIVADPSEVGDQTKYVVVEFTPRWEKRFGFNDKVYETMRQAVESQLKGKWVQFSGWMLFDFVHANASQSTAPNNPVCPNDGKEHPKCNWRATPWEVHPVTAYKVVSGPE